MYQKMRSIPESSEKFLMSISFFFAFITADAARSTIIIMSRTGAVSIITVITPRSFSTFETMLKKALAMLCVPPDHCIPSRAFCIWSRACLFSVSVKSIFMQSWDISSLAAFRNISSVFCSCMFITLLSPISNICDITIAAP